MTTKTGFDATTSALILERDGGRCFWCRNWVASGLRGVDYSLHHRCPRGSGGVGKRDTWTNKASNGLTLCGSGVTGCHGWVESKRGLALDLGLLVSRVAATVNPARRPALIPVTDRDGARWWLTDDGRKEPVGPDVQF
ncbi:HNH endonuclease [Microbacterium sp. No. 7]|uniref:HNH endonuclease n=1 Tax=Microbacterium sp. No. 7 TaxID=1714373 RepID=UPI0006ECD73D|nr:HNH endonuclease [Microbacterium sp. No. 7]ALJ22084.1 hypothetical protein AOA12_20200 [Microbacterium sp. No. 7]